MAMELYPLDERGQRLIAADLAWVLGSGWSLSDLADEHHAKSYVRLARDDSEVVGLAPALPKKGKVFSLAALCALHAVRTKHSHAAYVLQISEGACALFGVLDGLPAIGYDRIGANAKDVLAILAKFQRDAEPDEVYVHTNIADLPGSSQTMAVSLPTLIALLDDKQVAAAARVMAVPGNRLLPGMAAGIVLAAGVWFAWQAWQAHEAQERIRRASANQKPPQQVYEESLPAAFAKAGWPLAEVNAVLGRIATIPLERGGWTAEKVACNIGTGGCVFSWVKSLPSASFATFVAATSGGEKGMGGLNLAPDRITETLPIKATTLAPIPMRALRPQSAFLTGAISELQRLSGTGAMQLALRAPEPFATADMAIRPVMQGGIIVSGELYLLPLTLAIDGRQLSASTIEITFGAKPSFKADFNYYASKP